MKVTQLTGKILSLIIFIGSITYTKGLAQISAQATMRASVQIVQAVDVQSETVPSIHITSANQNNFDVGYLRIKGLRNSAIYIQDNVEVKDQSGKNMRLKLRAEMGTDEGGEETIRLFGSLSDHLPSKGLYKGDLSITIEHM